MVHEGPAKRPDRHPVRYYVNGPFWPKKNFTPTSTTMVDVAAASASHEEDSDDMLSSPASAWDSEFDEEEIMRAGAVDDADWELARGGTFGPC